MLKEYWTDIICDLAKEVSMIKYNIPSKASLQVLLA